MIRGVFNKSLSVPKRGLRVCPGHSTSTKCVSPAPNLAPIRSLTQSFVLGVQTESSKPTSTGDNSNQPLKELRDMPGPWRIPLLGLSPEILMSDPKKSIQYFSKLPKKYGSIVKVKVPTLPELVCVFDPEDAKVVFRNESKYPRRLPLEIWEESRTAYGKPVGLFLLNGEEWHKQRKPISKFMAVPRKVAEYHEPFNDVSMDLITSIRRSRNDSDMVIDTAALLQKWAFETVNVFLLGKRLGCLDEQVPLDCQKFIDQIDRFFTASHRLLFGLSFHKIYATKDYKDLLDSFVQLFDISMAHIKERLDEIDGEESMNSNDEPPVGMDFLQYMSKADKMPLEVITTNAIDLMGAGVDTTSFTLLWTLYSLAVNTDVQTKLREEVVSVLGSDSCVTPTHIQHMPYMRDCIKEAMRLYAIAPNNSRILDKEIVLSGYRIPAGTAIMMPIVAGGAQADNFPDPDKFKPERWSRGSREPPNPFASLPFGVGARMCVGRRVAELELHVALAQLIKTFSIEFRDDKPMDYIQNLFLSPERRFDLAFIDL